MSTPARTRGTMATSRMRKLICPGCGVILRGTRTALATSGLPYCGCGERFTCPNLEDLAAVAPDDERLTAARHAADEYAGRSVDQMTRWARRGSVQPARSEMLDVAHERAAAAVQARVIAELEAVRARPVATSDSDEIPF